MDSSTAAHLIELNRQFYQTFGLPFASSRSRLPPGVQHILEGLKGEESILDLGCGNGGVGRVLARHGHRGTYLGLDFSQVLLAEARRGLPEAALAFLQADLTSDQWECALDPASFDLVLAFAVLHHIPGRRLRVELLGKVRALLRQEGKFIHSEWQFQNSAKLAKRIQPWEQAGIAETEVDPGDALIDWRQGGRGLRYVHAFDEKDLASLAAESGFKVQETFYSDGEGGKLGLYQVWGRKPDAAGRSA
jgi:SAM-dependent methyltransferase